MYSIKCINTDGTEYPLLVYGDPDYTVAEAKIKESVNKSGVLVILLPPTNPSYDRVKKLESEVVVTDLDGDVEIFRGRCMSDEKDFYNIKQCECEGAMSYLLDTKQGPYLHTGSITDFLRMLLDNHNAKVKERQKIRLGNVTVVDSNNYLRRSSEKEYAAPLSIIQEKIVKTYSGLLEVRRANGVNYLDYLAEYPLSDQTARFGENILDLNQYANAEDVRTVIIPLGAEDEETGKRLTIASVNSGKDYLVNTALVDSYGWIEDAVEFDDVTLASNLKTKGEQYMSSCANMALTIELTAVDCRLLGMEVRRLRPGMRVRVVSEPHGLDTYFLCSAKETDLLEPDKDRVSLGNELTTYTGTADRQHKETQSQILNMGESLEGVDKDLAARIQAERDALAKEIQNARNDFNTEIKSASGLYKTEVNQSDGSTITYYHDKQKLTDSTIQMVFNTAGFAVSADGGNNWYGLKVDGDFIANILETEGIKANWIRTGELSASLIKSGILQLDLLQLLGRLTDKKGRSYWDMETGELMLDGAFVNTVGGKYAIRIVNRRILFYDWEDGVTPIGALLVGDHGGTKILSATLEPGKTFEINKRISEAEMATLAAFGDLTNYQGISGAEIGLYSDVDVAGHKLLRVGDIELRNGCLVKSYSSNTTQFPLVSRLYMSGDNLIIDTGAGTYKVVCTKVS